MKLQTPASAPQTNKGFTLIELLIVIAIIAILSAILFPVFARARENARRSTCQSNLKQISLGLLQYVQDYDELVPSWLQLDYNAGVPGTSRSIAERLQPYVNSKQIFICPSQSKAPVDTVNGYKSTYCPNVANGNPYGVGLSKGLFATATNGGTAMAPQTTFSAGTPLSQIPVPATTIAFSEFNKNDLLDPYASWSPGRLFAGHMTTSNYAFADGHVKALHPEDTIATDNMWTRADDTFASATTGDQTQIKAFVVAAKNAYQ